MGIRDWPASERPRERLLDRGPQALSDAELVALLLAGGRTGGSSVDLARAALLHFGGLGRLLAAPRNALAEIPGLGLATYARLQAVDELGKRVLREQACRGALLDAPAKVRDYLRLALGRGAHEVFAVLFLDSQNRLLACEEMFRGTLTQTSVYPREIVKQALRHNSAAVILAHNHPSGVAEPSRADEILTRAVQQALALVDVRVLDHLVVASAACTSLAERGLL